MGARLGLTTLGGLQISRGAEPLRGFESRKAQALLVYIAMEPQPHSRAALAGLLWSNLAEPRARGNLRRVLTNLRHLVAQHLVITPQTIAFDTRSDYWLDVDDFKRLPPRQALELYHGDFLAGFYVHNAPVFEEWMLGWQERLRIVLLQSLYELVTFHRARGEYYTAITYARQLLTFDPWREEIHRELMRLLVLTGQRSAALAQYEKCRQVLAEELNLEPLEETRALYEQVRDARTDTLSTPSPPAQETTHLPFTGREKEHATLITWWEQTQHGKGPLALVEGEAGIGKTRLVEEVARYAEAHGATVLRGRCYEFGNGLPYQPIAESLRGYLRTLSASTATHPLPSLEMVWWAELARLLPEVHVLHPNLPEPAPVSSEAARQRLFEAVAHLLSASPTSPSLLFLDDLHWADQSTIDLLHYLVRRLQESPIWIVGTYRPGETQLKHPLMQLKLGLGRDRLVNLLPLEPLSSTAVLHIAHSLVGERDSDAFGTFLYQESEGNPFVLSELVEMSREEGMLRERAAGWEFVHTRLRKAPSPLPAGVRDMILQRVSRLSEAARRLLTLAAVIGRRFDVTLLKAAAGQDADAVENGLHEWLDRHLVRPIRHSPLVDSSLADSQLHLSLDFSHDKIRAVIYQAAEPGQRQILHRRVGEALETSPTTVESHPGMLAHHWEQAGEPEKATTYLLRAGDQARLVYAHQEAVDYYQRALAHLEAMGKQEQAAHTLMKLGLTYHNAFDFRRAHQAYDDGFALWQQAGARHAGPVLPATHTLRVRWLEPVTLDPAISPDNHTACLMAHLFSGLVELDPEMSVVPDIARTWEVSDGGRRFVFHLRDDVRWSDGVPVTAHDFEYAWKRVLNPATGTSTASLLYNIKGARAYHRGDGSAASVGVRASDEVTLLVELEQPTGYFMQLLTHASYNPVPRHVVEQHGPAWTDVAHIVTNGPFTIASWERGRSLLITRYSDYHGQFKGNVQQVALLPITDWATRLQMYEDDKLDALGITFFPPATREKARQRHASEYISKPLLETQYVAFDVRRPPFDDARVRQALALATDREQLANQVLGGYVAPASGGLVPPGMPGHWPGIGLPYDPPQARRLLAAAGYPDGRGFPPVRGLAFRSAASRCSYLQAQWRANLGIEVEWKVEEWAVFLERLQNSQPAMVILSWAADYPDPDNFLRVSHVRSWPWCQNDDYDRLVERAGTVTDREERMRLYRQAEQILAQEAAILPLVYEREHLLLKPWVSKYPMSAIRPAFWKDVVLNKRQEERYRKETGIVT